MGRMNMRCFVFSMIVCFLSLSFAQTALSQASSTPPAAAATNPERELLLDLSTHRNLAIGILQVCISRAKRAELVKFCQQAANEEQDFRRSVQKWLIEWYGAADLPSARDRDADEARHRSTFEKLRDIPEAQFEEPFLREMRQYYRQEIEESPKCKAGARHAELTAGCDQLRKAQEKASQQIDQWICDWLRDCVATRPTKR